MGCFRGWTIVVLIGACPTGLALVVLFVGFGGGAPPWCWFIGFGLLLLGKKWRDGTAGIFWFGLRWY